MKIYEVVKYGAAVSEFHSNKGDAFKAAREYSKPGFEDASVSMIVLKKVPMRALLIGCLNHSSDVVESETHMGDFTKGRLTK